MIRKLTLVEKIADIVHSNHSNTEMTYEEIDVLSNAIAETLEGFSEDAQDLIDEWNEDARVIEEDRKRGLSGQY